MYPARSLSAPTISFPTMHPTAAPPPSSDTNPPRSKPSPSSSKLLTPRTPAGPHQHPPNHPAHLHTPNPPSHPSSHPSNTNLPSSTSISDAIQFVYRLIGTPYVYHPLHVPFPASDTAPFWNIDQPPPPIDTIRTNGICCAGLVNLARRFCGLPIPHPPPVQDPGGTLAWFHHLDQHNVLIPLPSATYSIALAALPRGTLLIEPFSNETQGHLAILLTSNRLLHAYPPQVSVDPPTPRFTHACLPNHWLLPPQNPHTPTPPPLA